jgi:Skp family chaperone for outer membrane proteins
VLSTWRIQTKVCVTTILAILHCLALQAQQGMTKVAVVNGQAALVGTQEGKKALERWNAKLDTKKKEFEARQNEIAQLEDQLSKGASVMTRDKKEQLLNSFNDKKKRLQRDVQDADEETQRDQQQSFQPLEDRLNTIIDKYAADNGYALVIDVSIQGSPVRYAAPWTDITKDVVTLYDKTYGIK